MPFVRPTLPELVDRVQQDFVSRLALAGAVLRRSMVYAFARVVAGAAHMLHGHLEYIARQLFADTADREYLERQARVFGITPNPAGYAKGTVSLTGTNGQTVPAGTVLLAPGGAEYATDADATIAADIASASVTASEAGAAGTLTVGLALSFESPVAGVDSAAPVTASTQDGADEEDTEALRTRLLERLRNPAHGGAEADYIAWAKEVPGVTRVWIYPHELGIGSVVVRFMRDDDVAQIPDSGEVTAVQGHLDAVRPVTAAVTVVAPTAAPLGFILSVVPDTAAVRAAVTAELADLLQRVAEPGGTLLLSQVRTAIGTAEGLTNYTLTSPAADVTHSAGEIATMGTVAYV